LTQSFVVLSDDSERAFEQVFAYELAPDEADGATGQWLLVAPGKSLPAQYSGRLSPAGKAPPKSRPPPPPSSKGASKGGKAPPPAPPRGKGKPPSLGAPSKAVHSGPPAKPPFGRKLHWKAIPAEKIPSTIFAQLTSVESKVIDIKAMEQWFAQPEKKAPQCPKAPSGPSGDEDKGQSGICILDGKRTQNITIMLRQVTSRIAMPELLRAIQDMEITHQALTSDLVDHLSSQVLPALEQTDLADYNGSLDNLRPLERDLVPLLQVHRLRMRLKLFQVALSVDWQFAALRERITNLRVAAEEVQKSKSLRLLLSTTLRIGNFLNCGVVEEQSAPQAVVGGFTVESLLKLRDFKTGGLRCEFSALHGVIMHLADDPNFIGGLKSELGAVTEASREDMEALAKAISAFQATAETVAVEVEDYGEQYGGGCGPLKALAEKAQSLSTQLSADYEQALEAGSKCLEFFAEDVSQTKNLESNLGRFLQTVDRVVATTAECWQEVMQMKAAERRKAARAKGAAAPLSGMVGGPVSARRRSAA